ncbi:helix-turn-helix domain-containing protein, partial [Sulfobacillus sp. hq2]|uniref:MerR family DNA-binding transcriptional regulator n=1 Tax=Sulfobacillus sp. hq2 TaxID=2039167 RepID=UPI001A9A4554
MERLVSIREAAKALGVSMTTLRRWEAEGRLMAEHTPGGHRRYWRSCALSGFMVLIRQTGAPLPMRESPATTR